MLEVPLQKWSHMDNCVLDDDVAVSSRLARGFRSATKRAN